MALLQVINGMKPGQQFPIEGEKAIVGRHPECDIVLDVGAISRQHAQILKVNGAYFVEDLKSRNGTFVNGQLISGRHRLTTNDQLKICDILLTFLGDQPAAAPAGTFLPPRMTDAPEGTRVGPAMMIDDGDSGGGTTIMSTLDIGSQRTGGLQMSVNPELKLKALLEITRNLGAALSIDDVLPKVLDSLFKIFIQADRSFVVLKDEQRGILIPKAVKLRRGDSDEMVRVSRTIVNKVMESKEAILSADAASDQRFDTSQSIADFRIRSMMCAPLVNSNGVALGVIQVDTLDQRSRFQQDDLDVLGSVACQASIAIENAQLHEVALARSAIDRDLELAHKVQHGILPSAPPIVPGYEFFDYYDSANQVGGDYFDYVTLPGGRLGVVLADVSGKGISAALVMARLSSETRYCMASEASVAQAMTRLNAGFCRGGWEDRFVTMVLAVIDLEKHELTVANAGHMPPYLTRADGSLSTIGDDIAGVPLGVTEDFPYEEITMTLAPGDDVTIFTDGISEAMNVDNELFGFKRLEAVLNLKGAGASALGASILDAVKKFAGTRAQSDDMCLICLGRKP